MSGTRSLFEQFYGEYTVVRISTKWNGLKSPPTRRGLIPDDQAELTEFELSAHVHAAAPPDFS